MMQRMYVVYLIVLGMSFSLTPVKCQSRYNVDEDGDYGMRIAGNDQLVIFANNQQNSFAISFAPFTSNSSCSAMYWRSDICIYSVAVVFNNDSVNNDLYTIVAVGETRTLTEYLIMITVNKTLCEPSTEITLDVIENFIWYGRHQEYMSLKMDPSGTYAYVFADSFILSFDIINNQLIQRIDNTALLFSGQILPHAVDIIDSFGILVGYLVQNIYTVLYRHVAALIDLHSLSLIDKLDLNGTDTRNLESVKMSDRGNDMSVVISPTREMVIIGVPMYDRVLLFNFSSTNTSQDNWRPRLIRTELSPQQNIGFGHSVAWLNETTVAIVALTIAERPWSTSEVWVFDVDRPFTIPLFIFPNTQQTITISSSPYFLQMLSCSNSLYLQTDQQYAILVPSRAPGFISVEASDSTGISIYEESLCVAGTYRNVSSVGPCIVCPPQTKNPGDGPCSECSPCGTSAFCPMGSVDDTVSFSTHPSYTQTFTYPDSPDIDDYDDLLLQNIFGFFHSARCVVMTPLFWAILVIVICFLIWLIMVLLKLKHCSKASRYRKRAKNFFKHTDIINEGERWIGGLISFAIFVLFAFIIWFACDYVRLYPIETSGGIRSSCDQSLRNADFDNGLQLPLPNADGSRWAIFDMLDAQPFTLTIDLVNTRVACSSLSFQLNRPGVKYLLLPIAEANCILQPDNVTRSVSVALPVHRGSVQLNLTGPFFVGGFRLCLRGPAKIQNVNTLHALDACQFFSTPNQTISSVATLSIVLVKVVNQTKPLKVGDDFHYDGRWTPTFGESWLSDELIYEQDGSYLRYMSQRTTLTFTFSEQPFFLQNNQKPIVRIAQLAFHTLLFCSLIIELFGMGFLLFKLAGKPLLIRFFNSCLSRKRALHYETDQSSNSTTRSQPDFTVINFGSNNSSQQTNPIAAIQN